jgi:hypothetical protein
MSKAPKKPSPIPSRGDINVFDSLDEREACKHFLGKNLDEAEGLLRENFLYYQEDLMWMGPRAFTYYVHAAINYIHSDSASANSDTVNCLAGLFEFWFEHYRQELLLVAEPLAEVCRYILDHWIKFAVDPRIYGDLRARFVVLAQAFEHLGHDA